MQSTIMQQRSAFGARAQAPRPMAPSRGSLVIMNAQSLNGKVVSTSMKRTVIVAVERLSPHDKYFKRVTSTQRYLVDADEGSCNIGDYVRIDPTRPLSKAKRFKLGEVVRKAD